MDVRCPMCEVELHVSFNTFAGRVANLAVWHAHQATLLCLRCSLLQRVVEILFEHWKDQVTTLAHCHAYTDGDCN